MLLQEYEFEGGEDNDQDAPDLGADIKDLEFRLTNNLDQMQVCVLIFTGTPHETSITVFVYLVTFVCMYGYWIMIFQKMHMVFKDANEIK